MQKDDHIKYVASEIIKFRNLNSLLNNEIIIFMPPLFAIYLFGVKECVLIDAQVYSSEFIPYDQFIITRKIDFNKYIEENLSFTNTTL